MKKEKQPAGARVIYLTLIWMSVVFLPTGLTMLVLGILLGIGRLGNASAVFLVAGAISSAISAGWYLENPPPPIKETRKYDAVYVARKEKELGISREEFR